MKANKLILLLLPFLLSGCSKNNIDGLSIEQAQTIVDAMGDNIITEYHVTAEGYLGGIAPDDDNGNAVNNKRRDYVENIQTISPWGDGKAWGLSENLDNKYLSGSHFLCAPLRVKSFDFYKEITSNGVTQIDSNYCFYGYMKSLLIYADSLSQMHIIDTEDGGFIVAAYNSSTLLTIHNMFWSIANFTGRINAEFTYNADGYLVSEKVYSNNYNGNNKTNANVLYLESNYEY